MAANLRERFLELPDDARKQVHQYLCAQALEGWQKYTDEFKRITYNDSVVGMFHVVDLQLPADAFNAAFLPPATNHQTAIAEIDYRYQEPMTALQTWDLEFPDNIQLGYYSIYNAFRKYARAEPMDDWLIVNQALSVATNERNWNRTLEAAIQQVARCNTAGERT